MTRLILIGDPHIADQPPRSRITYRDDILDKMSAIVDIANDLEDLDAVVSLGDTFHVKRPDRTSHALVADTAEILGQSKAPVLLTVGNHDIRSRLDTLHQQPLASLLLHPNVDLFMGTHDLLPDVYAVPYFDVSVEEYQKYVEEFNEAGGKEKFKLVLAHQSLFPRAQEPIYDYISYEDWAERFQVPYVAYGHIHSRLKGGPFFPVTRSDGEKTIFCNNGAISRGSLHEETINRELAVTLYDDSMEQPFTSITIPYKPASEVFKLEEVELNKTRDGIINSFIESLGSTELNYLTVESI